MNQRIRIGIVGYGNLGKGVEAASAITLIWNSVAVFTRRNPEAMTLKPSSKTCTYLRSGILC